MKKVVPIIQSIKYRTGSSLRKGSSNYPNIEHTDQKNWISFQIYHDFLFVYLELIHMPFFKKTPSVFPSYE
jgi:hypothetical protein